MALSLYMFRGHVQKIKIPINNNHLGIGLAIIIFFLKEIKKKKIPFTRKITKNQPAHKIFCPTNYTFLPRHKILIKTYENIHIHV